MHMPEQKPGRSRQDYGTPTDFLDDIQENLIHERFVWDLAADETNTAVPGCFYDEAADSLSDKCPWAWAHGGWAWLNPPFAKIGPWVLKAYTEALTKNAQVCVLVPASVGSIWWAMWVHQKANVFFVRPRLTFVGEKDPYPKDLALLLYDRISTRGTGSYNLYAWN